MRGPCYQAAVRGKDPQKVLHWQQRRVVLRRDHRHAEA